MTLLSSSHAQGSEEHSDLLASTGSLSPQRTAGKRHYCSLFETGQRVRAGHWIQKSSLSLAAKHVLRARVTPLLFPTEETLEVR